MDSMWAEATTTEGKTYYYHRETRETVWVLPTEQVVVSPVQQPVQQSVQQPVQQHIHHPTLPMQDISNVIINEQAGVDMVRT